MGENKKRIFISIALSDTLAYKILERQILFKKSLNQDIRWIAPKNLHITLVPPFYVSLNELKEVAEILEKIKQESFRMEFSSISFGPDPKRPRLIWAEGESPKELINLKEKIEAVLRIKSEVRPYKLHLTLARFRPEDFKVFAIKKLNEKINWQSNVNSFVVMESRLSRGGAEYEKLYEIKLGL